MSLREEIEKFFLDIGEDGEKAKTQVILSKIEKRIDERLENYKQVLHKDNDNDYTRGCLHTYQEIKEMLK